MNGFGGVLILVALLTGSGIGTWWLGHYEAGAILLALGLGVITTTAIVEALLPYARQSEEMIRDRRILADRAGEELMLAAGACAHVKGSAVPRCDCALGSRW